MSQGAQTGEAMDRLRAIPTAGAGLVRLDLLGAEGEAAGRERFERLVTAIVMELHPSARAVKANPGDWGIDTFVGELARGRIAVWQSKYFVDGVGDGQKKEIRESFKSVVEAAGAKGFRLDSWTLAIPVDMDAPATRWWDGWKKRQRSATGIHIDLWPQSRIEGLLLKPDFVGVRQQYFGVSLGESIAERAVFEPEDLSEFDGALFVHQLRVAGIAQDTVARRAFFNAEVMSRDVQEREVRAEMDALATVRSTLHQMWHTRFEAECATISSDETRLPRLYPSLMSAVESYHQSRPSRPLRDTLVHRSGLVHHLVETGHAGWVRDFLAIAESYQAVPSE